MSDQQERRLSDGSEAIAQAAIDADCRFYASYPIQPNTHLIEAMAKEIGKVGGVHINAESEGEAISMVWGAAATGARAMCSTTATGMSLMQEAMSEMFAAQIPYVFVHMSRGQTEYRIGTRGGGHGEYRYIAYAPHTVQEAYDLTRLAFYTAHKYTTPVLVQSDYVLSHTVEAVDFQGLDESDLPDLSGRAVDGARGRSPRINSFLFGTRSRDELRKARDEEGGYGGHQERSLDRIAYLEASVPTMVETGHLDDADLVVVGFGYAARFMKYAVKLLRDEGSKIGFVRPITLWPFPKDAVAEAAEKAKRIAVFELNAGQMVDDVRLTVLGKVPVDFIGRISQDSSGFGMGKAIEIPELTAKIRETYEQMAPVGA